MPRIWFSESTLKFLYRWALPLTIAVACSAVADVAVDRNDWLGAQHSAKTAADAKLTAIDPNGAIAIVLVEPHSDEALKMRGFPGGFGRRVIASAVSSFSRAGVRALLLDVGIRDAIPSVDPILRRALIAATPMRVTLTRDNPSVTQGTEDEPDHLRCSFPRLPPAFEGLGPPIYRGEALLYVSNSIVCGFAPIRIDHSVEKPILHSTVSTVMQFYGSDPNIAKWDDEAGLVQTQFYELSLRAGEIIFVHPLKRGKHFVTLSIEDALSHPSLLKDKLVVFAVDSPGDRHLAVGDEVVSGGQFLAECINTLLLLPSKQIADVTGLRLWSWWIGLSFLTAASVLSRKAILATVGVFGALVIAWVAPQFALQENIRIEVVSTEAAIAMTFALAVILSFGFGNREEYRPAGIEEEATAMFVDLCDSTSITDLIGPREYQRLHSNLNSAIATATRRHNGLLERTTGDGAICIFRGSAAHIHAISAVECARELSNSVAVHLSKDAERLNVGIRLSIGIESGIVSGGYVVESGKRNWSSAGSAVILAQRLQSAASTNHESILIGPIAAGLIRHRIRVRSSGSLTLKGFSREVQSFTPETK